MSVRRDIEGARKLVAKLGAPLEAEPEALLERGPLSRITWSLVLLSAGERGEAAQVARAAGDASRAVPIVDYLVGVILHVCGDFEGATGRLLAGMRAAGGGSRAQIADALRALAMHSGREDARREALECLAALPSTRPAHLLELAELAQEAGDEAATISALAKLAEHAELGCALEAWVRRSEWLPGEATRRALDAWIAGRREALAPAHRRALAGCFVDLGALDRACELVEGLDDPLTRATRARWALWRGELEAAGELARAALDSGEALDRDAGLLARWVAAVAEACASPNGAGLPTAQLAPGLAEPLRAILDAEGRSCDDPEPWCWRFELELRAGASGEGMWALLDRGQSSRGDDGVVVGLLGALLTLRVSGISGELTSYRSSRGNDRVRALGPRLRPLLARVDPQLAAGLEQCDDLELERRAWLALGCLGGYRGGRVATVLGGEAEQGGALEPARIESELGSRRIAWAEAELAAHREAHPEDPRGHLLRAELACWRRALDEARAALAEAEARDPELQELRWIAARVALLEGRAERALALCAPGDEAASARLLRAEALWRLGRAQAGLWYAAGVLDEEPRHVAGWCLVGLCGGEELALPALARLEQLAPELVARACGALELGLLERPPGPAQARALLERALLALAGNRGIKPATFERGEGELQRLALRGDRAAIERRDSEQLRRAVRALARLLKLPDEPLARRVRAPGQPGWIAAQADRAASVLADLRPAARPRWRRVPRREQLGPEEIEHFVGRGFLRVRACFGRDEARAWVEAANRRIAADPERWVKGYSARGPGLELDGYDPERRETWTWPRLDVYGERSFTIERWSPRTWAVICELLGGPERVATRTWNDAVIPNFRLARANASPDISLDAATWHIDNPRRRMTLSNLTNGLICVLVLAEIGPGMGGTVVAPGSLARVARALEGAGAGADFIDRRLGRGITRACEEIVELTGEPGDVYFLHPLLMHSPTPNPSPRVRWIGNPLVELHEPLEVWPEDPATRSPVERAIAEALD